MSIINSNEVPLADLAVVRIRYSATSCNLLLTICLFARIEKHYSKGDRKENLTMKSILD